MKRDLLTDIAQALNKRSQTPALDAQVLLAHITGKTRAWLLAHPELELTPAQQQTLHKALDQLARNTPLPYVIGHWEFFGLDFILSPDVLIPRPETEELVELALDWLRATNTKQVLDVGTGSGCIPIALARHARDLNLLGVDLSESALNIARQNAELHGEIIHRKKTKNAKNFKEEQRKSYKIGTSTLCFIQNDLLDNLPLPSCNFKHPTFNLITANLPYIPTETLKSLEIYTREPTLALDGGTDGLTLIRRLLKSAPPLLAPKGLILLETDSSLGQATLKLADEFFPKAKNRLRQDLAGRDRFVEIQT